MADFRQMGGIPEGYDQLLNSARQQLVKMPDGTYRVEPQFGAGTSLDEIYGGILPKPSSALTSRSVTTVPIDVMTGQPLLGFAPPTMADTRAEQSGSRPAITQGVQPAGTTQMPPGVTPQSVQQAFAQMGVQPNGPQGRGQPVLSAQGGVWDPFNPNTPKDQSRLPANAGEQAFMQAFYPQQGNAATAAIDQATATPMPRPRPDLVMPFTPSPNLRGSTPVPRAPSGGSITFKRGDTVSQLAQDRGMTTQQFAKLYGIANPNKIIAGQTVSPVGMAASPPSRVTTGTPSRTSLVSTLKSQPTERRKSIYVDEFGMVF